ncbi:MAG: sigma factor-like helix-turn-helix DNA-binding protein, partial [Oscillospiraceae bacterium]
KRAVLAMELPDREIFLRHYYYYQALAQISVEMEINVSTVKTRLRRGREKLKEILHEGGYSLGNENI